MQVYVAMYCEGGGGECHIRGIFSTRELAELFIKKQNDMDDHFEIEVFTVDGD